VTRLHATEVDGRLDASTPLGPRSGPPLRSVPRIRRIVIAAAALAFVAAGLVGAYRYVHGFWLYRGFPAPREPAFVDRAGTTLKLRIASPALGGRRQVVYVYLPPGYREQIARRYPVLYLLHGFPGRPAAFLQTIRVAVVEDVLLAKHVGKPMILVMPSGSTGTFTDKEWADGVRPHEKWETWVARDLVRTIDRRFRTVRAAHARGIGGLSEGGYAAINLALHRPGEFGLVESWSGYERADDIRPIFGGRRALLRRNSPLAMLPLVAGEIRARHTYFWLYSGSTDKLRFQNEEFARELASAGIPSRFRLVPGGHDWSLWRGQAGRALLVASRHLRV
jgi:enterochelin esterase-like enzyme